MARNRTLAELQSDVQIAADVQGKLARHPLSEITRYINEAIQAFRVMVSESGHQYYLGSVGCTFPVGTNVVTFPVPATDNPWAFFGLDIIVNGVTLELAPLQFQDRNRYGGLTAGATNAVSGVPRYYITGNTSSLAFTPRADATYSGVLTYIAGGADLALAADTFDGIAGWEDWVVWEAASRVALKDGDAEQMQVLLVKKQGIEELIRKNAPRRMREVLRRTDTRSRRRALDRFARFPWWS